MLKFIIIYNISFTIPNQMQNIYILNNHMKRLLKSNAQKNHINN